MCNQNLHICQCYPDVVLNDDINWRIKELDSALDNFATTHTVLLVKGSFHFIPATDSTRASTSLIDGLVIPPTPDSSDNCEFHGRTRLLQLLDEKLVNPYTDIRVYNDHVSVKL